MAATILTSMVLLPTMAILVRSHDLSDRLAIESALENACASLMDQRQAELRAAFVDAVVEGDLADAGLPGMRFQTTASTVAAMGGIPDRLMTVRVVVWQDLDGDQSRDRSELFRELWSKIARDPHV